MYFVRKIKVFVIWWGGGVVGGNTTLEVNLT